MTPNNREELVELMARAICTADGYLPDHNGDEEDGHFLLWMSYKDDAVQVLTALDTAGIALVPREQTNEMFAVGVMDDIYAAMLSASPFRPKQHGGGDD